MSTKLTQTAEKAAKRHQRRSQGSLPPRPAPFLRGGDETWPRLETIAAQIVIPYNPSLYNKEAYNTPTQSEQV